MAITIELEDDEALEDTEAGTFRQSLVRLLRDVSPIIGERFLPPYYYS